MFGGHRFSLRPAKRLELDLSLGCSSQTQQRGAERVAGGRVRPVKLQRPARRLRRVCVPAVEQVNLTESGVRRGAFRVDQEGRDRFCEGFVVAPQLEIERAKPVVYGVVVGVRVDSLHVGVDGSVEVRLAQLEADDGVVQLIGADDRVPFEGVLKCVQCVPVPQQALMEPRQPVRRLARVGNRAEAFTKGLFRRIRAACRDEHVHQRHVRAFVPRVQADCRRELVDAPVHLLVGPIGHAEDSVSFRARREPVGRLPRGGRGPTGACPAAARQTLQRAVWLSDSARIEWIQCKRLPETADRPRVLAFRQETEAGDIQGGRKHGRRATRLLQQVDASDQGSGPEAARLCEGFLSSVAKFLQDRFGLFGSTGLQKTMCQGIQQRRVVRIAG